MYTYTTCGTCGGPLTVDHPGHELHATCPDPPGIPGLKRKLVRAILDGDDQAANHYQARLDEVTDQPRMLAAALAYAAWGWRVFPLRPGLKAPASGHGFHDATTDDRVITAWWTRSPAANIGVATGRDFDVIDIDPAGRDWWARVREDHSGKPGGPVGDIHGKVYTPRGGWHLYVRPSGRGNLANVVDGVDYRGRGGYVVVPPSRLAPEVYQGKDVWWQGDAPETLEYQWFVYPSPEIKRPGPRATE